MTRNDALWCLAVLLGGLLTVLLGGVLGLLLGSPLLFPFRYLPENIYLAMFIGLAGWALAAGLLFKIFTALEGTPARKSGEASLDDYYRGSKR